MNDAAAIAVISGRAEEMQGGGGDNDGCSERRCALLRRP